MKKNLNNISIIYKYHFFQLILIRLLYGRHYLNRYRKLIKYIPNGDSVLDVCSGDCSLYHIALKGRNPYTGVDLNISRLNKNRTINQLQLNILEDPLPYSDIIILQGSLYQFHPFEKKVIDKLINAAHKGVIISEPIKNIAESKIKIIKHLAEQTVNPGTGIISFRFTKKSLCQFFYKNYKHRIKTNIVIAGGRDMVFVLSPNG